jgi:hypothetical protein
MFVAKEGSMLKASTILATFELGFMVGIARTVELSF